MTKSIPGFFGAVGATVGNRNAADCETGQAVGFIVGTLVGIGVDYLVNKPRNTTYTPRPVTEWQ